MTGKRPWIQPVKQPNDGNGRTAARWLLEQKGCFHRRFLPFNLTRFSLLLCPELAATVFEQQLLTLPCCIILKPNSLWHRHFKSRIDQ
jgi:hypothetical protein